MLAESIAAKELLGKPSSTGRKRWTSGIAAPRYPAALLSGWRAKTGQLGRRTTDNVHTSETLIKVATIRLLCKAAGAVSVNSAKHILKRSCRVSTTSSQT